MRKHLAQNFDAVYLLDLGGNVRKNPKLSGTTHNVFGIQVGVSINLFIRRGADRSSAASIYVAALDQMWRKEQKYAFLETHLSRDGVQWRKIVPSAKHS
jgi:predicted helicase